MGQQFIPVESWAGSAGLLSEQMSENCIIIAPKGAFKPEFGNFLPGAVFFSIDELLNRFCLTTQGKSLLTGPAIQSIIASFLRDEGNSYFNIAGYRPGYAKAITEFLVDYREQTTENLSSFFKNDNNIMNRKRQDILKIHERYEEYLEERQLFDARRIVMKYDELLLTSATKAVFWGFSSITPLENLAIKKWFPTIPAICFFFISAIQAAQSALKVNESVLRLIDDPPPDLRKIKSGPGTAGSVENLLFKEDPEFIPKQDIFSAAADDRRNETETAARWIRKRANGTTPADDFSIYLSNYDLYASYIKEIFPRYGLKPLWGKGLPYKIFPLAQFLKNLINQAVVPSPFTLRRDIFCSSYFSFEFEIGQQEVSAFQLDNPELAKLNISINDCLGTHCIDYRRILANENQAYRSGFSIPGENRMISVLNYLNSIGDRELTIAILKDYLCLKALEKVIYPFSSKITPDNFIGGIKSLLSRFSVEENIRNSEYPNRAYDLALLASLPDIFNAFTSRWTGPFGVENDLFPLDQLARGFLNLANESYFQPASEENTNNKTVPIYSTDQIPYSKKKYVLILGLTEGEFPVREKKNFLTQSAEGRNIFRRYSQAEIDRERFYQFACEADKALFCSYPLSDGGKGLQISSFLEALRKIASPARSAPKTADSGPLSMKERLLKIGRTLEDDKETALALLRSLRKEDENYYRQLRGLLVCQGLRSRMKEFSVYDGLIKNHRALDIINNKIRNNLSFSPAEFELYAGCPLRFFLNNILDIQPDWLLDYDADNLPKGRFVLEILDKYTEERINRETDFPRLKMDMAAFIEEKIPNFFPGDNTIFDRQLARQFLSGLKNPDERAKPGLFSAFLDFEENGPDLTHPDQARLNAEIIIDKIPVKLEIPRIDKLDPFNGFLVYNYTSGDIVSPGKMERGLAFLLPLQIFALQNVPFNLNILGAGYIQVKTAGQIKKGGYLARKEIKSAKKKDVSKNNPIFSGQKGFGFLDVDEFNKFISATPGIVENMIAAMGNGLFNLPMCAARDQLCFNCSFSRFCRKEQTRLNVILDMDPEDCFIPGRPDL